MFIRSLIPTALLLIAGCVVPAPAPPPSEYELNLAKWQAAGLENYEFDYQLGCECTDESIRAVHIIVQAGRVIEARYLDDGSLADLAIFGGVTVDSQFARIERAVLNGAETVNVSYDPELGYPTDTFIHTDPRIADAEAFEWFVNLTPR